MSDQLTCVQVTVRVNAVPCLLPHSSSSYRQTLAVNMKIQQTFLIAYCHVMTYCYSDTRLCTETDSPKKTLVQELNLHLPLSLMLLSKYRRSWLNGSHLHSRDPQLKSRPRHPVPDMFFMVILSPSRH
jgi:hypothetical protein